MLWWIDSFESFLIGPIMALFFFLIDDNDDILNRNIKSSSRVIKSDVYMERHSFAKEEKEVELKKESDFLFSFFFFFYSLHDKTNDEPSNIFSLERKSSIFSFEWSLVLMINEDMSLFILYILLSNYWQTKKFTNTIFNLTHASSKDFKVYIIYKLYRNTELRVFEWLITSSCVHV